MKIKILIVEDQFIEANNLKRILELAGYWICSIARSVPIALQVLENEKPDLVLVDIYLKGNLTGIDLAKSLQEKNIAFVFISANSDKQILDAAKSTKPYGFLVKPFREKDVLVMLDVAWYLHQENLLSSSRKDAFLKTPPISHKQVDLPIIIGTSPLMLDIVQQIRLVSQSDTSVLVLGESGTGKELVAQGIHRVSSRKAKPLVVVNCATLPADLIESELFGHEKGTFTNAIAKRTGKFEQANGGTIFLDEIGELPLDVQVKFLRVLQEQEIEPIGGLLKKIDVRIITATNKDLEEEVAAGRFRIDLYYRLNVFPILLPPLRERKEDLLILANHFINHYSQKENKIITGFADHVIKSILDYNWPGNVRELENLMERSVLLASGTIIDSLILPASTKKTQADNDAIKIKTMDENERDHILAVLEKCGWKIYGSGGAAEILAINASTLSSRMKKLGINNNRPVSKQK